jgi:hypothetical protein
MDRATDRAKSDALLGNACIYKCLVSYRASAARFFQEIASEFPARSEGKRKGVNP